MIKIITIPVTLLEQNCRVIYCSETYDSVVVDPGGDSDKIIETVKSNNLNVKQIWLTHSHFDHCGGVKELLKEYKVPLYAHKGEDFMRQLVMQSVEFYNLPKAGIANCPEPDHYIDENQKLSFAKYTFDIFFTPGHSPGHLCFYNKESSTLIAGDTLFNGSIGRTDLPGGNHQQLIDSIKSNILNLADETKVLSGHGPDTTVGKERESNPYL